MRSTREVIESHLALRKRHAVDEDLAQNYHPDVLFVSRDGLFRGHDAVRKAAAMLQRLVPGGRYVYDHIEYVGDTAFLKWRAFADHRCVLDGVDSFKIVEGRIAAQTAAYTVDRLDEEQEQEQRDAAAST